MRLVELFANHGDLKECKEEKEGKQPALPKNKEAKEGKSWPPSDRALQQPQLVARQGSVQLLLLKLLLVSSNTSQRTAETHIQLHNLSAGTDFSLYKVNSSFGFLRDSFRTYVVCKQCSWTESLVDCIHRVRLQALGERTSIQLHCPHTPFPHHRQVRRREACGQEVLTFVDRERGVPRPRPLLAMPFCPLLDQIARLLQV